MIANLQKICELPNDLLHLCAQEICEDSLANSYFYLVRINSYNLRSEKMEWKELLP